MYQGIKVGWEDKMKKGAYIKQLENGDFEYGRIIYNQDRRTNRRELVGVAASYEAARAGLIASVSKWAKRADQGRSY
jgi:hypothetical protein